MTDPTGGFFLIGGSGRSGTTILCRAMGLHPDVTDVPEWRFMTDVDGIVDFYRQADDINDSPFHYDRRLRRLEALLKAVTRRKSVEGIVGTRRVRDPLMRLTGRIAAPAFARTDATSFSPAFQDHAERLIAELTDFDYPGYWVGGEMFAPAKIAFARRSQEACLLACRRFVRAIADDVRQAQGARHHLEKNTWNTLWFNKIREIVPEAKLVHIVRDPRDVVASYAEQPWSPPDAEQAAHFYQSLMDRWQVVRAVCPDESYLEIRLEDLVAQPRETYERLCGFWGLDWHDVLLETKLSSRSFGRWREQFSEEDAARVTAIVAPTMKRYGYEA